MTTTTNKKSLSIALWTVQVLLFVSFLMAGIMKSTQPIEELGKSLPWALAAPAWLVRFIGISELAGGLGLLVPSILRIKPNLTPLAALGIIAIMVLAFIFHTVKAEYNVVIINIVLGGLAYFVYWGRTKKLPIVGK